MGTLIELLNVSGIPKARVIMGKTPKPSTEGKSYFWILALLYKSIIPAYAGKLLTAINLYHHVFAGMAREVRVIRTKTSKGLELRPTRSVKYPVASLMFGM